MTCWSFPGTMIGTSPLSATPDVAPTGGQGMENMHMWNSWDVMGDWTTRCIEVEDWMDVPWE